MHVLRQFDVTNTTRDPQRVLLSSTTPDCITFQTENDNLGIPNPRDCNPLFNMIDQVRVDTCA